MMPLWLAWAVIIGAAVAYVLALVLSYRYEAGFPGLFDALVAVGLIVLMAVALGFLIQAIVTVIHNSGRTAPASQTPELPPSFPPVGLTGRDAGAVRAEVGHVDHAVRADKCSALGVDAQPGERANCSGLSTSAQPGGLGPGQHHHFGGAPVSTGARISYVQAERRSPSRKSRLQTAGVNGTARSRRDTAESTRPGRRESGHLIRRSALRGAIHESGYAHEPNAGCAYGFSVTGGERPALAGCTTAGRADLDVIGKAPHRATLPVVPWDSGEITKCVTAGRDRPQFGGRTERRGVDSRERSKPGYAGGERGHAGLVDTTESPVANGREDAHWAAHIKLGRLSVVSLDSDAGSLGCSWSELLDAGGGPSIAAAKGESAAGRRAWIRTGNGPMQVVASLAPRTQRSCA